MGDVFIPLHRQGKVIGHTVVDRADAAKLTGHRWMRSPEGYACRRAYRETVFVHRLVLGLRHGDGRECDHINGDPLDNRRENLRVCTRAQNGQNVSVSRGRSRFRGVSWHVGRGGWQAQAKANGRYNWLGLFSDENEAGWTAAAFRMLHMPFSADAKFLADTLGGVNG